MQGQRCQPLVWGCYSARLPLDWPFFCVFPPFFLCCATRLFPSLYLTLHLSGSLPSLLPSLPSPPVPIDCSCNLVLLHASSAQPSPARASLDPWDCAGLVALEGFKKSRHAH